MECFEIHITGDKNIIKAGDVLSLKTIVIDLLKSDKSYYRTEHMTSQIYKCDNYNKCKEYVDGIVDKLKRLDVDVKRIKIECPFYKHYIDQSLYFEIHYKSQDGKFPLSRNQNKDYCLATVREYEKDKYLDLYLEYKTTALDKVMELCLYDTNIKEDQDWFDLYA